MGQNLSSESQGATISATEQNLSKDNVSLLQINWKAVPQFRTHSCKTRISIVAE